MGNGSLRVLAKPLLTVIFLSAALGLAACGAPQGSGGGGGGGEEDFITDLQLGTGSVGGVYFPLGQEIATILSDNIDVEGFNVSSVETGASVDNLAQIARGDLQLGLAQNNTAQEAVAGEGEFEGAAIENAGWMGQLYPEAISIITLESTGIESVEDLEGQRIAIGPPAERRERRRSSSSPRPASRKANIRPLRRTSERPRQGFRTGTSTPRSRSWACRRRASPSLRR